jgi:hypothetical protein
MFNSDVNSDDLDEMLKDDGLLLNNGSDFKFLNTARPIISLFIVQNSPYFIIIKPLISRKKNLFND